MSVLIVVEGDPVGKGRPRASTIGGRARLYTPAKTKNYEQRVKDEAIKAMGGMPYFETPCLVELNIICAVPASYPRKKREQALAGDLLPTKKPDTDNVLKAVCDAFNGVVWRDDVLATDFIIRKRFGEQPCICVRVTPLSKAAI
jgi:Holliday junction resolvase RusA-like endonuclease